MYAQHFKGAIYNQKMIVAVTAFLMTALYFYAPIKEVSTWGISVFALLTALLIFCFSQEPKVKPASYTARSLVWIGQRSYEMYLFHLIVLGLMKVVYFPKDTLAAEKLMLLPVYFIAVFILSWAIEKYYSTPTQFKNSSILDTFVILILNCAVDFVQTLKSPESIGAF
jgi:peptidoglycan/LPS O-acetylase OafA/YrhL